MSEVTLSLRQKKVDVSIEYCVPCNYSEQALQVAQELLQNEQHRLSQLLLVMGSLEDWAPGKSSRNENHDEEAIK